MDRFSPTSSISIPRIWTLCLVFILDPGQAHHSHGQVQHRMGRLSPFSDASLHRHMEHAIEQMNAFHGDSAMAHINSALAQVDAATRPEERHYLLSYRAEVLYYEGLFNEAMRDLDEAQQLAEQLRDSTLIANAFNLKGILHENIQDSKEALPYMRQALHWFPRHPASRYPVSELYHIHGNLGSHLTALGRLDSAERHLTVSLELASAARAPRAMAVAWWGLGNLDITNGDPQRALDRYHRSWIIADSAKDHDIGVDALVGKALALAHGGHRMDARSALKHAFDYLQEHRHQVGLVTQRNFARQAARAFQHIGALDASIDALAEWHRIDSAITANNIRSALGTQAQLLKADGELNMARVARERVAEQLHNTQRTRLWVILVSFLVLTATTVLYLVNSARQRHRRRLAEVQAEHAMQERTIAELRVREQVSRDLHDDLGVGLSALKLRSEMAILQDPQGPAITLLREQAHAAEELITSMRHIIWALQDDQGSLDDLSAYIAAHTRSYLDAHGIAFSTTVQDQWPAFQLTTQLRRNVFLVMKEALHNVVKHARAEREPHLALGNRPASRTDRRRGRHPERASIQGEWTGQHAQACTAGRCATAHRQEPQGKGHPGLPACPLGRQRKLACSIPIGTATSRRETDHPPAYRGGRCSPP